MRPSRLPGTVPPPPAGRCWPSPPRGQAPQGQSRGRPDPVLAEAAHRLEISFVKARACLQPPLIKDNYCFQPLCTAQLLCLQTRSCGAFVGPPRGPQPGFPRDTQGCLYYHHTSQRRLGEIRGGNTFLCRGRGTRRWPCSKKNSVQCQVQPGYLQGTSPSSVCTLLANIGAAPCLLLGSLVLAGQWSNTNALKCVSGRDEMDSMSFICFVFKTGSHCSPGCPRFETGFCIFQAGLKFSDRKPLILLPLYF